MSGKSPTDPFQPQPGTQSSSSHAYDPEGERYPEDSMYSEYEPKHRPESFDVSYYTNRYPNDHHPYMNQTYEPGEGSTQYYGYADGQQVLDAQVVGHGHPLRHMNHGKKKRDDETESTTSEGVFSLQSSFNRAPYGQEQEAYGSLRATQFDEGRYASYAPSSESLIALLENKKLSRIGNFSRTSSWVSNGGSPPIYEMSMNGERYVHNDHPYPAWSDPHQVPLSKEEIMDIFHDLKNKFGFQLDNTRNQYDALMMQLDSRASRMSPSQALLTLHADYIGGQHANYRTWYFSCQLDREYSGPSNKEDENSGILELEQAKTFEQFEERWREKMNQLSQYERARQLALWLLLWGEAANVRFTSECLCFLFKCAYDYLLSPQCQARTEPAPDNEYLNTIITPLYMFIREQGYEVVNNKFVKRERDHADTIGYDDVNELFWSKEGLQKIILEDKSQLMALAPGERYPSLARVNWKKVFYKTYKEKRTVFHLAANFSRIWIIHICMCYYYTVYNSPFLYEQGDNTTDSLSNKQKYYNKNDPAEEDPDYPADKAFRLSLTALGGALACFIAIVGTLSEISFLPGTWANLRILLRRFAILFVLMLANMAPFGFIMLTFSKKSSLNNKGQLDGIRMPIAIVHFIFSLFTTFALAVVPPNKLFFRTPKNRTTHQLTNPLFTSNYPALDKQDRGVSLALWACIFACKFIESYFFLALSFKDPFNAVYAFTVTKCTDKLLGSFLCQLQPKILSLFMILLEQILFFLDTYLWYIIWTTLFSVANSFLLGISIWTPWRNIFARLPKRIYAKILATADMEIKYKPKVLCSQIWNAIIISMYREHLLSVDHVQKLLYQQVPSEEPGKRTLKPPTFFVAQEDTGMDTEFFPAGSEAERRISFFAQSLSTRLPEPIPVENMPTFTVLTPHYSEKILLSLREIIRENDQFTRVTLLEYLKALHPVEWENFVKDTKVLAEEHNVDAEFLEDGDKPNNKSKIDDLPLYSIGFKSAAPEFTLRTRIWASLRSQTLYRTISGMFNYSKAIKLLYRVENPEMVQLFGGSGSEKLEKELERMSRRKFTFVVSMQRFTKFNKDEKENVEFLLRTYPDLKIAYLEEVAASIEGGESLFFSCLIDGHCDVDGDGVRKPIYRVQLPGNPILGDGKSDNQNHAVIFYRGEYMQLIDANQDNYLEEAIKIRSILGEFEQYDVPNTSPYSPTVEEAAAPIAILGAREYIFSENIGVLGDVAAGKEQTFGTLTGRILASIGGKLHYGHPDFLNAIFMMTRGGVSKAQKGLHLNEDIYAGMNAFNRGGRIKHLEYFQCGKGRDLGFGSVLSFFTKIGSGMGEQMLSREQYYLSTQLPIDRFLTFYYAHPGFHVNNIFIMISIHLFMFCLVVISTFAYAYNPNPTGVNSRICVFTKDPLRALTPKGCFNLWPILEWIQRTTISILLVFILAYLPLVFQVLTEQGFVRVCVRLGKQVFSLSPLFEVFATQIYSTSLLNNLSFGGARYIATGRGFATTRIPFSILYTRFAGPCMYVGMRLMFMLLYASLVIWVPHLIYFWITIASLCISPFIFNPHQFSLTDFLIDYREFLHWLSAGNVRSDPNSWISHCRQARIRITGYKRKKLGEGGRKIGGHIPRASKAVIMFSEVVVPFIYAILALVVYCFINSVDNGSGAPAAKTSAVLRVGAFAFLPVIVNMVVLAALFGVSLFFGPVLSVCMPSFGTVMAGFAHGVSCFISIGCFFGFWFVEKWVLSNAVLGTMVGVFLQRALFSILMSLFLTREFGHDETNMAWWTGKWFGRGLGWAAITQPLREYLCKIIESSMFAADCLMGHIILFFLAPFCLIPYFEKRHSLMLFWLRPSKQIRPPIYSLKQKAERRRTALTYGTLFFSLYFFFVAAVVVPQVLPFLKNIKFTIPLIG